MARAAALAVGVLVLSLAAPPAEAGTLVPRVPSPAPAAVAPAAVAPSASQRVGALAARILREMRASRYAHLTVPLTTRPGGVFVTDCSGWVKLVLHTAAPGSFRALRQARGTDRPTSWDYALGIPRSTASWQRIPDPSALQAGDVIAWTRPPGSTAGHAMIAAGTARKVSPGRWRVAVIDSTSVPHGAGDTRRHDRRNGPSSTNGRPSGVGRGAITLITGRSGRPVGYIWTAGDSTVMRPSAITMARPLR